MAIMRLVGLVGYLYFLAVGVKLMDNQSFPRRNIYQYKYKSQ